MGMAGKPSPTYAGNPKHKRGRNRGRRGSYCPGDINASQAQKLLDNGVVENDRKRFGTDGQRAFCAYCHDQVKNEWHGYPVAWYEVPPPIRKQWIEDGTIKAKVVRDRSGSA
jgi:hypothetical protein